MQVLKVELEGLTTSFRYPHLLVGRQPSFPMPPPATIYGHAASTLGFFPNPDTFRFAYTFTTEATVDDFEHAHELKYEVKRGELTGKVSLNFNPVTRQVLFEPRLTLYFDTENISTWHRAFLEPRFPVALGRSQDLAAYKQVEVVELEQADSGYYEHTLLPWSFRPRLPVGEGVFMPRFIDPNDRQRVLWSRYVALGYRVFHPRGNEVVAPSVLLTGTEGPLWVDPSTEPVHERQRIVVWNGVSPEERDGSFAA